MTSSGIFWKTITLVWDGGFLESICPSLGGIWGVKLNNNIGVIWGVKQQIYRGDLGSQVTIVWGIRGVK